MQTLSKQKTAVLVFAFSSKEEIRHKKINDAEELFSVLSERTLTTVQKTKLPYILFTEKEQQGSTFGERFANAIEYVFNKGYNKVITIGNDTPQLTPKLLLKANNLLSQKNTVLGPSTDGGFYLMGIHKNDFDKKSFVSLPWQTPRLYQQLVKEGTPEDVSILELEYLRDIDSLNDVKDIFNYVFTFSRVIKKLLFSIIHIKTVFLLRQKSHIGLYSIKTLQVRGSPPIAH